MSELQFTLCGWDDDANCQREFIVREVAKVFNSFYKNEYINAFPLQICLRKTVQCDDDLTSPCTHFDRSKICITVDYFGWCQFVHQVSHELCHCSTSRKQLPQKIKWFDEFICCFSSYLVEQIIAQDQTNRYDYIYSHETNKAFADYAKIEQSGHIYRVDNVQNFFAANRKIYETDQDLIKSHDVYVRTFFVALCGDFSGLSFVGKMHLVKTDDDMVVEDFLQRLLFLCNANEKHTIYKICRVFGIKIRLMKDSGIKWIGQIPEDWQTIRLKGLFINRTGGAWGDEAKGNDGDRVCIRVADFDFGTQTVKVGNKTLRNYEQKVIERLKLEENDLLIEKSGGGEKTPVGRTIIATRCRGFLFANFIERLRVRRDHFPKYIAYLFRSLYYNGATYPYIKQTTGIQNLDIENLLRENVFVPIYAIQQRIADFLDIKCEKIDTLIANQQEQMEKLKEYKQAIITESVTKGFDKSATMKDSGIKWIGQIPECWSTIRFKDKYVHQKEIAGQKSVDYERLALTLNGVIKRAKDDSEGLQPKEFDGYQIIYENDFIFKMIDLQNISTSRVGFSPYVGLVSPAYIRFSPRMDNQYNKFVYYFLMSMYYNCVYNNLSGNGVRSALDATDIGQFIIPYPSIGIQREIADYLDKKCADIDSLISIKQRKIEKLQEYKKSLIYEYVTGKKEVC